MANLRFWIPAIVAAASLLPAQGPSSDSSANRAVNAASRKAAPAAFVIGVVDLDKAIDRYGVAVRERDRLQQLSDQYGDEINKYTKNIDELRGQLSLLKPGSSAHDEKQFEMQTAMQVREGFAKLRKKQFDSALEAFELEVYEDLEYAIARVAKDRGVAVVLRAQHTLELPGGPDGTAAEGAQQAKLRQFNRRTIWYTSEEVDLTPFLIKYLQVFDPRAERLKAAAEAAANQPAPKSPGAGNNNPGKSQPKKGS